MVNLLADLSAGNGGRNDGTGGVVWFIIAAVFILATVGFSAYKRSRRK